jgi:hypothetical protein
MGSKEPDGALLVACGEPRGTAASRWGAIYAAFILAPVAVGAAQWRDPVALAVCVSIAVAVATLYLARHGSRPGVEFRVTTEGIWLSPRAFVPAARYVDIELRRWTVLPWSAQETSWVGLSVVLDDGRELCVPSVTRALHSESPTNHPVELSTNGGRRWFELPGPNGMPLRWTAASDAAVLAVLRDRIDGMLDKNEPSPRPLAGVAGLVGTRLRSGSGVARAVAPGDRSYCFDEVDDD